MVNSLSEIARAVKIALKALGGRTGPSNIGNVNIDKSTGVSVLGLMMRKELRIYGGRKSGKRYRQELEIAERVLKTASRLRVENRSCWPYFMFLVEGGTVNSLKRQLKPEMRVGVEIYVRKVAETIENEVGAVDIRELLTSRIETAHL